MLNLLCIFFIYQSMAITMSVYLHRAIGHNHFILHPALEHFFRFWLWFTAGFAWPNWMQHYAAQHRKHHRHSDTELDPHSPRYFTFLQLCDVYAPAPGKAHYITEEDIKRYAPTVQTPNDWVELNIYEKYPRLGPRLFWLTVTALFGWAGFVFGFATYFFHRHISAFFSCYIIHKIGFKYAGNQGTDRSRILIPWSIFAGGEEIHAHHHNDPSQPKFSRHWWELDTGWVACKFFIWAGLMKVRKNNV